MLLGPEFERNDLDVLSHHPDSDQEAEIVQRAAVVHLVHVHAGVEEGHDEGDEQDSAMPESEPESRDFSARIGDIHRGVRTCGAARHDKHEKQWYSDPKDTLSCHSYVSRLRRLNSLKGLPLLTIT